MLFFRKASCPTPTRSSDDVQWSSIEEQLSRIRHQMAELERKALTTEAENKHYLEQIVVLKSMIMLQGKQVDTLTTDSDDQHHLEQISEVKSEIMLQRQLVMDTVEKVKSQELEIISLREASKSIEDNIEELKKPPTVRTKHRRDLRPRAIELKQMYRSAMIHLWLPVEFTSSINEVGFAAAVKLLRTHIRESAAILENLNHLQENHSAEFTSAALVTTAIHWGSKAGYISQRFVPQACHECLKPLITVLAEQHLCTDQFIVDILRLVVDPTINLKFVRELIPQRILMQQRRASPWFLGPPLMEGQVEARKIPEEGTAIYEAFLKIMKINGKQVPLRTRPSREDDNSETESESERESPEAEPARNVPRVIQRPTGYRMRRAPQDSPEPKKRGRKGVHLSIKKEVYTSNRK